MIAHGLLMLKI